MRRPVKAENIGSNPILRATKTTICIKTKKGEKNTIENTIRKHGEKEKSSIIGWRG